MLIHNGKKKKAVSPTTSKALLSQDLLIRAIKKANAMGLQDNKIDDEDICAIMNSYNAQIISLSLVGDKSEQYFK